MGLVAATPCCENTHAVNRQFVIRNFMKEVAMAVLLGGTRKLGRVRNVLG